MAKGHLSNLFEYNIVKVKKDNKKFKLDFKSLDKLLDICKNYNIKQEIELIGLLGIWSFSNEGFGNPIIDYSDAIRIRYYDEDQQIYRFIDNKKELLEYIKGLVEYFSKRDLVDKLRLTADEPTNNLGAIANFREWNGFLKSINPFIKNKVAVNNISFKDQSDLIDDIVIYIETILKDEKLFQDIKKNKNGKVYWYTCCGQFPDTSIRANLLESRFIGWLTEYLDIDGFMRWNYTVWPKNPREKIYWNAPLFPAGENNFVYPNKDGSPLLTIRYKNLLRGIQDYELIQMLKEIHPKKNSIIKGLFKKIIKANNLFNSDTFSKDRNIIISLDYKDYDDCRKSLMEEINKYNKS